MTFTLTVWPFTEPSPGRSKQQTRTRVSAEAFERLEEPYRHLSELATQGKIWESGRAPESAQHEPGAGRAGPRLRRRRPRSVTLESDPKRQLKCLDSIDIYIYSALDENERQRHEVE